jgi:hypothetical protein
MILAVAFLIFNYFAGPPSLETGTIAARKGIKRYFFTSVSYVRHH